MPMYFFIIIIFFSLVSLSALIGLYWGGYLGKDKKNVAVVIKPPISGNLLVDDIDVEDLLHRRETAKVLADYLLDNPNLKHAVGVSITGTWGTGKSTFLHFLSLALQERNCMPIIFDPWTEQSTDIRKDLFRKIGELFGKNDQLSVLWHNYTDYIKVTNVTGWFSLCLLAVQRFFVQEELSLSSLKNKLREELCYLKDPVVIFIDDSDRLEANGFREVLSLIRCSIDLPRIIFVVAYDPERAKEMLKEVGGEHFMRKMFNVSQPLLPLGNSDLYKFLGDSAKAMKLPFECRDNSFGKLSIKDYLPTFRDAKSYLNLIYKDYQEYKNFADNENLCWEKWGVLELLKYTDMYTYSLLKNNPQALLEEKKKYVLNDNQYVLKEGTGNLENKTFNLLHYLFSTNNNDKPFDITSVVYYDCYFNPVFSDRFITEEEYFSIKTEHYKEAFSKYLGSDKTNLPMLVAEALHYLGRSNCLLALEALVMAYDEQKKIKSLDEIYSQDNYRRLAKIVDDHPCLGVLAWQVLANFVEHNSESEWMEEHCQSTLYPGAMVALMNSVIMNNDPDQYLGADYYCYKVLKRMVTDGQTCYADIIWMVGGCNAPNLPSEFLTDFLNEHFLDCIAYTLTFIVNENMNYVVAKSSAMITLFDTYSNFVETINRWKDGNRYDSDILHQYEQIVTFTQLLTSHNSQRYQLSAYPAIEPYKPKESICTTPIQKVYIEKEFWENKSRYKIPSDYYFAMNANV